jgi:hypothetical protein
VVYLVGLFVLQHNEESPPGTPKYSSAVSNILFSPDSWPQCWLVAVDRRSLVSYPPVPRLRERFRGRRSARRDDDSAGGAWMMIIEGSSKVLHTSQLHKVTQSLGETIKIETHDNDKYTR